MTHKIKRNAGWMFIGNSTFAALQAINLIILGRLLGPSAVGSFSFALALTAPIMLLTNLGLRNQLMTDVHHSVSFPEYQVVRRISSLAGLLITLMAGLIATYTLPVFLTVAAIGIAKTVENQSEIFYGHFQRTEQHKQIALSLILRGIVGTITLSVALLLSKSVVVACFSYALGWGLVLYLYDQRVTFRAAEKPPRLSLTLRWQRLRPVLWQGIPLGISAMLISLNMALPRLVLSFTSGMKDLGVFASLVMFLQLGSLAVNSLGQSVGPRLARYYINGNRQAFLRLTFVGSTIAFATGISGLFVAWLAGNYILSATFGSRFSDAHSTLTMLFAIAPLQYASSFAGYVVISMRKNFSLMRIHSATAAISLVAALSLIPIFGIDGAIYTMLLSAIASITGYGLVIVRTINNMCDKQAKPQS